MVELSVPNAETIDGASIVFISQEKSPTDTSAFTIYTNGSETTVDRTLVSSLPGSHLRHHLVTELPSHLRIAAGDVHVIVSSRSGTGKAEEFYSGSLKPILEGVGLPEGSYRLLRTESQDTIKRYASVVLRREAERGVDQTVLLLAGDGGTVDVVNGLWEDGTRSSTYVRPKLILFPLGTGNALFHSLQRKYPAPPTAPSDLTLALRTLLHGASHPLPSFRASFSAASLLTDEGRTALPLPTSTLLGVVVASYGFHATLVADSDTAAWRVHSDKRFSMVAQELLADPHHYKARITLRKARTEGEAGGDVETVLSRLEHGYVLATLVSNLEKTFRISPASEPLDGKLRMVHFGPVGADVVMRIMGAAYAGGGHVKDEAVGYEEVDGFRIDFLGSEEERWRRVCVDGLILKVEEGGWMDVVKVKHGMEMVDVVL